MADLILHHYGVSPFSEKARRILAFKRLPFRSVRAPAVMPKPDVVALTGGYRKIPILQIGADVYCDTSLMARVLEARAPEPTLFPTPLAQIVADWADVTLFETTVPVCMRPTRFDDLLRLMTPEELSKIQEDRAEMRKDARSSGLPGKIAKANIGVLLDRLDRTLSKQDFVMGAVPSIADFSVYHSAWFLETTAPEPLAPFEHLKRWMERVRAMPLLETDTISSEDALGIARESKPAQVTSPADPAASIAPGANTEVRPLDYGRDPVLGELVHLGPEEVVLRRTDPRAGTVHVHFPRLGYEVTAR